MFSRSIATDKEQLQKLGITHLLNTAEGKKFHQVNTSEAYYRDVGITYYGVPAMDIMTYPLHKYFRAAAEFIQKCLDSEGNVINSKQVQDIILMTSRATPPPLAVLKH